MSGVAGSYVALGFSKSGAMVRNKLIFRNFHDVLFVCSFFFLVLFCPFEVFVYLLCLFLSHLNFSFRKETVILTFVNCGHLKNFLLLPDLKI